MEPTRESGQQAEEGLPRTEAIFGLDRPERSLGFLVGSSPVTQRLFAQMRSTAPHLRIATLEGEGGSGKTAAARTLHALGPASSGIFLSCPAAQFLERRSAVIHESRNGTLLLSHVEDLSSDHQLHMLQFLQWLDHQHARRTPDSAPRQVFFSSNQSVRKLVATFSLRIDLANRLTVIRFTMPPLRERREDIALLADHFAEGFSATYNKPLRRLSPQALPGLLGHPWPGNVRELERAIHAAVLQCEGQWIKPMDLPALSPHATSGTEGPDGLDRPGQPDGGAILSRTAAGVRAAEDDPNLDRAIHRHVTRVLARVDGNKLRAARLLGISRSTLYRLLESNGSGQPASANDPS